MKMRQMMLLAVMLVGSVVSTGCSSMSTLLLLPPPNFMVNGIPAWVHIATMRVVHTHDDVDGVITGVAAQITMREGTVNDDMDEACEKAGIMFLCEEMKEKAQCAVVHPPVVTVYGTRWVRGEERMTCLVTYTFIK